MLGLFLKRFREHEWYPLLDFLSPVFFDIVPAWDMVRILTQLTRESVQESRQASFASSLSQQLPSWGLPLTLAEAKTESRVEPREAPWTQADVLLRLYFAQILHEDSACLDLRFRSFRKEGEQWIWQPRYFVWTWSPDFLEALRSVYSGFYEKKDELFRAGLRELNLLHAEERFRAHFGGDEQGAHRFSLKDFRTTFHEIFVSCREHAVRLPPEFLPFGLYLITLYEHLEQLGGAYDVRSAYSWAQALENGTKKVPQP